MDWDGIRGTYLLTAGSLPALVSAIDDFTAPVLGIWDTAGLAGHTLRAVTTVVRYLGGEEPAQAEVPDAAGYFVAAMQRRDADPAGIDAAVAQRGRDELAGMDRTLFAARFADAVGEATASLEAADPHRLVATPFGGMPLPEYLRTRLLEVSVHGLDLATAHGIEWSPTAAAVDDALAVLTEVARRRGTAVGLLLALTGRTTPPARRALPIIR